MPVIRNRSERFSSIVEDTLRRELTAELRGSGSSANGSAAVREPLVLENWIESEQALNVTVIWGRWNLVNAGNRTQLIVDAYKAAKPRDADQLNVVMGVTVDEAVQLGILPYEIVADDTDDVERLRGHGALETMNGPRLLFLDRTSADAVRDQLRQFGNFEVKEISPPRAS
jgi:hypothetical protein